MLPSVEDYKGPHPEKIAAKGTEHAHQTALFAWAAMMQHRYPELRLMFAIPNGGQRNIIVASNLKAEGCKAGVPDIFLPVARGSWHGLFIELKKKGGKPSQEQLQWIALLRSQGYGALVAIEWIEARDSILAYLEYK